MNNVSTITEPGSRPAELKEFLGASAKPPWWQRRWALVAAAGALLLAVLLISRCSSSTSTASYATEPVRLGSLTVTVSATGNLQPTHEVEVGSEQSGLVTEVYVDNNDRVSKGQPLARLDPSRLRDTLTQNRASLAQSEAQVAQSQASLTAAQGNLARLEEVYKLSGGKVPSRLELDNARAEQKRLLAVLAASRAQVNQARAVLSSAQTNLGKATIYSPVTGVVLSRSIDPGQTVAASLSSPTLFKIAEDLSRMKLEVKVDEADVGQVMAGQQAQFSVDAFPGRSFPATITRVDVGANASGASSGTSSVVSYTAVLSVANPDFALRPGMTATAVIVTQAETRRLLVPNSALRFVPDSDSKNSKGVASMMLPGRPGGDSPEKSATIGRGSHQRIYVLGSDGQPSPVDVITGSSNGSVTAVTGRQLKQDMKVITGKLASGAK